MSTRSLYNSELASSLAAQSRTLYATIISYLQSGASKTFRNVQITGGSLAALTGLESTFGSFASLTVGSKTVQDVYMTLLGYGNSVLSVMTNNIKLSSFPITLDSSNVLFSGTSKIMGSLAVDAERLQASAVTSGTTLSLTTPMNKVYCDNASDCLVKLPNGTQDGQIKIIQWLPTLLAPPSALPFPRLVVSGSFCFPQYQTATEQFFANLISDQQIILPTTGISVTLIYDDQMKAWVPMQSGGTFANSVV